MLRPARPASATAREKSRKERQVGRGSMAAIGRKARRRHRRRARDRQGDRGAARRRGRDADAARAATSSSSSTSRRELGAGAAACDIRDRAGVDAAFAAAAAERGPIHALVANSGLGGAERRTGRTTASTSSSRRTSAAPTTASAPRVRHLAPGPERRDVVVIASILARIAVGGYTGYSRLEGGAARARPLVRGGARARQRPGERDLPRLGRHRHGVAGDRRHRRGDRRHARRGLPRGDARRPARADGRARGRSPARSRGCSRPTRAASPARRSTRTAAPGSDEVTGEGRRRAPLSTATPRPRARGPAACPWRLRAPLLELLQLLLGALANGALEPVLRRQRTTSRRRRAGAATTDGA